VNSVAPAREPRHIPRPRLILRKRSTNYPTNYPRKRPEWEAGAKGERSGPRRSAASAKKAVKISACEIFIELPREFGIVKPIVSGRQADRAPILSNHKNGGRS
jgi:hypothetical protein